MSAARVPLTPEQAVAASAPLARSLGFFCDFDGTLATIHTDPGAVLPITGVVDRLVRLAPLVRRIAIVSARPVSFLAERFGAVPGIVLHGLYGLEHMRAGMVTVEPEVEPWVPTVRRLVESARHELPADVLVEDKHIAVALHFRLASHRQHEVEAWAGQAADRLGLTVQHGRMVVELKPPVARDKGVVVRDETADLAGAWYLGDDISDRLAFDVLTEQERRRPGFLGVRVAVTNTETGGALAEQADFVLAAPGDVPALLDRLTCAFADGGSRR